MSDELTTPRMEPPRLRLHHFFVLFAVTAVVLAISRSMMERLSALGDSILVAQPGMVIWSIGAVVLGGQITILALVVSWRWRSVIEQIQPGEWLSLIAASEALLSLVWWTLFFPIEIAVFTSSFAWLNGLMSCLNVFWCALLMMLLVRSRESLFWKAAYLILLIGGALPLLTSVLRYLLADSTYLTIMNTFGRITNYNGYVNWLMIPVICAAVVSDRRQKRERRWTHWLGVLLYVLQVIMQIVMVFWATFGTSPGGGWSSSPPPTP